MRFVTNPIPGMRRANHKTALAFLRSDPFSGAAVALDGYADSNELDNPALPALPSRPPRVPVRPGFASGRRALRDLRLGIGSTVRGAAVLQLTSRGVGLSGPFNAGSEGEFKLFLHPLVRLDR